MMFAKAKRYWRHPEIRYFMQNARYKIIQQAGVFLSGAIIAYYLANYTSKELYGNYTFILSVLGIVSITALPGIKNAITQSVARGYHSSLYRGALAAMRRSVVGSCVLLAMSGYYLIQNNLPLGHSILLAAVVFPFFSTLDSFQAYLSGMNAFKVAQRYDNILSAFKMIVILSIAYFFKNNLVAIVAGILVYQTVMYCLFFFICDAKCAHNKRDPDLIKYGTFMTRISALFIITSKIDRFLIGMMLGPTQLATYAIAILLPQGVRGGIKPMLSVFLPKFASGKSNLSLRRIVFVLLVSLFLTAGMMIILPAFISTVFPAYSDAILIGIFHSITLLFYPLNMLFQFYMRGTKDKPGIVNATVYPTAIKLMAIAPLIYFLGVYGAVIADIIGEAVITIFTLTNSKV